MSLRYYRGNGMHSELTCEVCGFGVVEETYPHFVVPNSDGIPCLNCEPEKFQGQIPDEAYRQSVLQATIAVECQG